EGLVGGGIDPGLDGRAAPVAADDADGDAGELMDVLGEVVADGGEVAGGGGRGDLPGIAIDGDRRGGLVGDGLLDLDVTDQREAGGGGDVDRLVEGAVDRPLHVGLAGGDPDLADDDVGQ